MLCNIIPVSYTHLILMSVGLCLITFLLCVVGGLIAGGFPDLNAQTLMDAGLLYLACLLYTSRCV